MKKQTGIHPRSTNISSWLAVGCAAALLAAIMACSGQDERRTLDAIASDYIVLSLAAGKYDDAFVDAWYGPDELAAQAEADQRDIATLRNDAGRLLEDIRERPPADDEASRLRQEYLEKQLQAMIARLGIVQGVEMSFDEETHHLFDTIAETHDLDSFEPLRNEVAELLPGDAPLPQRVRDFRERFVIPDERLDEVFQRAIEECRNRTVARLSLPDDENFRLEYVTDKPWSGYNWYQGDNYSLIQLNRSLPIELDRVVHLGCHEGYPGHHTYNVMLETGLVRNRGWQEFTVYPLFSPQSLIAEGSANYGVELAFPGDELAEFERNELLPMSGIEAGGYETYWQLRQLLEKLAYAEIQVARQFLDGEISREAARDALVHYTLLSPDRAEQRVKFIETYRGYIINYTLGRDIVADWIESQGGDVDARWRAFGELLGSPRLPSSLR